MGKVSLIENFNTKGEIVRQEKEKIPEGVLTRVQYLICNIGEKNHNNRKYRREVWDNVFADSDIKEKLKNRTLFGHAEHPDSVQSNVEKVSHVVNKIWIDESGDKVKAQLDVLDTPYGRIVNTLLLAGCGLGVSTRAEGELKEEVEGEEKFLDVIPETFKLSTIDFTADPSTIGVFPEKVEHTLVGHIRNGIAEKKIENGFATGILSNCKSKEATLLLEEINKGGSTVVKKKESQSLNDKDRVNDHPQSPKILSFLVDKWREFLSGKEAMDMLVKEFDITKEEATRHLGAMEEEMGLLTPAFAEGKSKKADPLLIKKQLRELNIKVAEGAAERDTALGFVKELEGAQKIVEEKAIRRAYRFSNRILELEEMKRKHKNDIDIEKRKLGEAKKEVSKLSNVLEDLNIENRKLKVLLRKTEESLEKAQALEIKREKEKKEIKNAYEKKIEQVNEEQKQKLNEELIKKYVTTKIAVSGLQVPENVLKIIKQSKDEQEADKFIEEYRHTVAEGIIRGPLSEITVTASASPDQERIRKAIGNAMAGM